MIYDENGNPIDFLVNSNTSDKGGYPLSAYEAKQLRLIKIIGWGTTEAIIGDKQRRKIQTQTSALMLMLVLIAVALAVRHYVLFLCACFGARRCCLHIGQIAQFPCFGRGGYFCGACMAEGRRRLLMAERLEAYGGSTVTVRRWMLTYPEYGSGTVSAGSNA